MTDTFTIAPEPTWPRSEPRWHDLNFHDGRKVTGRGRVTSHVETDVHPANVRNDNPEPPKHVVLVDLSPSLLDEHGQTVYRDAVPDADEIQSMHAVIRHPVRVNGGAYRGTFYVERGFDPATGRHVEPGSNWYPGAWYWRVAHVSLDRLDGAKVTDSARGTLHDMAKLIAAKFGTAGRLYADRTRDARSTLNRTLDDVSKANRAYVSAADAYNALARRNPDTGLYDLPTVYPGDVLADQIDYDLTNHATGQPR
jgi:hypothetical protein